jgi:hypothetical protein
VRFCARQKQQRLVGEGGGWCGEIDEGGGRHTGRSRGRRFSGSSVCSLGFMRGLGIGLSRWEWSGNYRRRHVHRFT